MENKPEFQVFCCAASCSCDSQSDFLLLALLWLTHYCISAYVSNVQRKVEESFESVWVWQLWGVRFAGVTSGETEPRDRCTHRRHWQAGHASCHRRSPVQHTHDTSQVQAHRRSWISWVPSWILCTPSTPAWIQPLSPAQHCPQLASWSSWVLTADVQRSHTHPAGPPHSWVSPDTSVDHLPIWYPYHDLKPLHTCCQVQLAVCQQIPRYTQRTSSLGRQRHSYLPSSWHPTVLLQPSALSLSLASHHSTPRGWFLAHTPFTVAGG